MKTLLKLLAVLAVLGAVAALAAALLAQDKTADYIPIDYNEG